MLKLTVLAEAEVEAIHHATLRILEESGVALTQPEGVEILAGAGAKVREGRVFLPPWLVERALERCPRRVLLRGRSGKEVALGDGSLSWHNLGGARDVYEPLTGQRRPAGLADVRNSTRLLDALEAANTVVPLFTPQDVPGFLMSLAMYRHALPFTTKPLQGPGVQTKQEASFAIQLASVVGNPREMLSLGISPVSPLIFPDSAVEAILEVARAGIAFGPLPCPTAGTTAPFSLAGALAQQNAEVLAAVVLAQSAHPGLPIIYCGRLAMMEPRNAMTIWSGVELGLASAATVQIAHRYHLPVNVYGFSSNAHTLDIQSGFERALNAAIPALAGADELSGIGEMAAGVMSSYAQLVCDDELAAGIRRLLRGFPIDETALAVDLIASVVQGARHFTGEKHTVRYLREGEVRLTRLAERRSWELWERDGQRGMAERAQAEATRLLAEHHPPPLSDDQERALDEIMRRASRELA